MSLFLLHNPVYAYHASATTDFVAIAILFVYIFIATAHLLYSLIRRRSSRAWEKLSDWVALALSSRPDPQVLSNTCAGIEDPHTRAKNVRIIVRGGETAGKVDDEDEEAGEGGGTNFVREEEEVQMVFVDSMHDGTMFGRVEAGVKYGKMD